MATLTKNLARSEEELMTVINAKDKALNTKLGVLQQDLLNL